MSEIDRIRSFLRGVRRRAYWEASLRLGGITLATILVVLLVMALCASHIGPAGFWPKVTATVLIILTLLGVCAGAFGPIRRLRSEIGVARFVGRRHPPLASDLLSAVELAGTEQPTRGTSTSILQAFLGSVATAVTPVDVRRLVPFRPAALAGSAVAAAAVVLTVSALLLPGTIARGLGLLLRVPTRFEGAVVTTEPLVGDVRISYTYPRYTGLPARVVEGSTGDIVAVKGTEVVLETKLLRRAREALLLLGEAGELGEKTVDLRDGGLRAAFKVEESSSYRIWLSPLLGRPVREARAHRIVAEADEAPRVEIFGPADRLELPTPRPIEVGFSATDDYGLGAVELVYRVEDGAEQRIRLKEGAPGTRATQGRTVFEPNLDRAAPGSRVAYRVEAKDNDGVSGSKTGSSRTLYIVIADPRESLDEQLLREREILDQLLDNLADRLEALNPDADDTRAAVAPTPARFSGSPGAAWDTASKVVPWFSAHEALESHVAALGRIIDDERRSGSGSKSVLAALSSIADRLARRLREEAGLLASLRGRTAASLTTAGSPGASNYDRLLKHEVKHAEELETAVLLLDDLIGRQRLEDLADMAKTLADTYKRLQDLLSRYQATKDEALRRQIEREIRDLRARIEQLGTKIAALKARNEVPSEWQNMPDLSKAMDRASEFSNLLEKGDPKSLQKALSELGSALGDVRKMLEGNAESFGENRFAQENKAVSEALKQIGELESDERMLAGDSSTLAEETEQQAAKARAAELDRFLAEARDKAERLRRRLSKNPPEELSEDGQDELKRAQESAKQLRRLLGEHEWGEGKKEAERAVSSLRRLRRELDRREQKNPRPSAAQEEFSESMGDARSIAQEIASDLEKLAPKPGEGMSQEQKGRSAGMAQRQRSLAERAEELAREAAKNAGKAGGLDQASSELREIGEQMGQAQQDLQRGDPREGSGKAREAADRLAKLRDELRDGRREANGRNRREPVRIPGADESKAPREWRQELLEAMRERAPERYGEEVRKYYEEIIK
jgi:hypothetical protein